MCVRQIKGSRCRVTERAERFGRRLYQHLTAAKICNMLTAQYNEPQWGSNTDHWIIEFHNKSLPNLQWQYTYCLYGSYNLLCTQQRKLSNPSKQLWGTLTCNFLCFRLEVDTMMETPIVYQVMKHREGSTGSPAPLQQHLDYLYLYLLFANM